MLGKRLFEMPNCQGPRPTAYIEQRQFILMRPWQTQEDENALPTASTAQQPPAAGSPVGTAAA